MMPDPTDAVTMLADLLEQENAALEQMQLGRAAAMLPAKQAAADALLRAQAAAHGAAWPDGALPAVARLRTLAAENRRLLQHGIKVQDRLIRLVARAVAQSAQPECGPYGAGGARQTGGRTPAVALAARA
jgi:hypothetical protein